MRDRLVCGLHSEPIQRRLLSEADLTLEQALTLAQGLEAADRNVKSLKGTETDNKWLTKTSPKPNLGQAVPSQKSACFRCGHTNHTPADCCFKEAECHNCGKRGHVPVCRGSKQFTSQKPPKGNRHSKYKGAQAKWVEEATAFKDELPTYTFPSDSEPIHVEVFINDTPLVMEIDTGAAVSLLCTKQVAGVLPRVGAQEDGGGPEDLHWGAYGLGGRS